MERKITDEIISVLMSSEIDIAEIKKRVIVKCCG
jgi:hypothetical protein